MKKFVLGVVAAGVLMGAAVAGHAQDLTYTLLDDTAWTMGSGVAGSGSDASITNILFDPIPNPFTYSTPSVLKFGDDFSTPGMGKKSTSTVFSGTPVDFHFMLDDGTTTDVFHVTGKIDGAIGYGSSGNPFSQAKITFLSVTDALNNHTSFMSIDPNNGAKALEIQTRMGLTNVDLFLDITQSKPAPNQTLSTAGYLTANAVPEGGTWTLLASSFVTGGLVLLRRKRNIRK